MSALWTEMKKRNERKLTRDDPDPLPPQSRNVQVTEVAEIEINIESETVRAIENTKTPQLNTAPTAPAAKTDHEAEIETGTGTGIVSTDTGTPVTTPKKPPSDRKHPKRSPLNLLSKR
jgi:hypothetical protein